MPRGKKKVSVAKAATTGKKGAKFSSGNCFKLESPEKDSRNVMWFCGHEGGAMAMWFSKNKKDEAAFLQPDFNLLNNNDDVMETLGINAVVNRKGQDGKTPLKQAPGSKYPWRQLLIILDEDENTPDGRMDKAELILQHFNETATKDNYEYPKKMKLGGDVTPDDDDLPNVSESFMDDTCLALLLAANPGMDRLSFLEGHDDELLEIWNDLEHAKSVVRGDEEV